jgi:Zn-dependent peptidase ImmA (M78 family)/transcriptional regulator with XRE-family HTH domain
MDNTRFGGFGAYMGNESFGQYAKRLRIAKDLGLREAARLMAVSGAYLSQVEQDDVPGSPRLIAAMARVYQHPLADIQSVAQLAGTSPRTPATAKQSMEELRSLYRVGGMFTAEEVESMIRHALHSRGVSDEEIETELSRLRADLPRIRKQGRDALFAAEIKPRVLSKKAITQAANKILQKNGLGPGSYKAPTPIELLVDNEDGVSYIIAQLPSTNGDPVVLGRTRWNGGVREITINTDLADSSRESDMHRFRFTLGHEFFHAIEHLQLPSAGGGGQLLRSVDEVGFVDRAVKYRQSAAERAVHHWAKTDQSRGLNTPEDWREWQANTFASAILMPDWAVTDFFTTHFEAECVCVPAGNNAREAALAVASEVLSEVTYAQSISQVFGVSRQAMAIRLLELGLVREVTG